MAATAWLALCLLVALRQCQADSSAPCEDECSDIVRTAQQLETALGSQDSSSGQLVLCFKDGCVRAFDTIMSTAIIARVTVSRKTARQKSISKALMRMFGLAVLSWSCVLCQAGALAWQQAALAQHAGLNRWWPGNGSVHKHSSQCTGRGANLVVIVRQAFGWPPACVQQSCAHPQHSCDFTVLLVPATSGLLQLAAKRPHCTQNAASFVQAD